MDFGLLALFALQLFMVAGVYHVWNRISKEIAEVRRIKEDFHRTDTAITEQNRTIAALGDRQKAVEEIPAGTRKRVEEVESKLAVLRGDHEVHGTKITSLGAKLAIHARWAKRDAGERDPDPQGEGEETAQAPQPPGFPPLARSDANGEAIPPRSFVVVRRKKNGTV